ncbi:MarR family transcriptional regulator [Litoreibacter ponti]|uniref:MarR family transcriptional regulator n=1 Tax=Litoreibacter ponti TaxID=1510457 RepID=A0A2T6BEU5_9RHOB|nr:MarR family transcriptional regulator [Litoreibacter ponti]PTX54578.1 MarR family transcriptional regulator [Litoreibacter ponti]
MSFDLQTFLPYLLNRAAEASSLEFQRLYKARYGMLRTEWRVLFHLGRYGPLTATEICGRAGLHKTKVSRAASALEAKRFLIRTQQSDDRRQARLSLTKRGQVVYGDLATEARAFEAELVKDLPAETVAILRESLIQIAGAQPKGRAGTDP